MAGAGRGLSDPRLWLAASGLIALLAAAPLAAIALTALQGSSEPWQHLIAYVLPTAVRETLLLLAGVGLLTAVVGTGAAWLVTAYDFPGRRLFEWWLLLPLAVPTYIVAYAYLDVLHPVGPVQSLIRAALGIESPRDFRLPDVRSLAGCIVLLGFVLYPYVYVTTRAMFLMQTANAVEAARTLGVRRRAIFLRVALPLARPAVAVGLSLALMEALNDIGASEFLGVRTMTVSIYTTWVTRSDLPGAAQIAVAMLALVLGLVAIERWARRKRRYAQDAQHPRPLTAHRLHGVTAVAALIAVTIPIVLGFVIPAAYLVHAAATRIRFAGLTPSLAGEAVNTLAISLVATMLTVAAGVVVVYALRLRQTPLTAVLARAASLGYAVPGTVVAIGLLPVVTGMDDAINAVFLNMRASPKGLLILGSGAALVYAYAVRFLTVAVGGTEAGFSRVSRSLDDAASTLGASVVRRLWQIHLPLVRPALAAAALLVFVDCMKELPATLLLRPIGFETLATHLYGEAVRGTYEDGAVAALLIVLVGLVPVSLLARLGRTPEAGHVDATTPASRGR